MSILDVIVLEVPGVLLVLEESVQLVVRGQSLLDLGLVQVSLHCGLQLGHLVHGVHLDGVAHLGWCIAVERMLLLFLLILQLLCPGLQVLQLCLGHLPSHVRAVVYDAIVVVALVRDGVVGLVASSPLDWVHFLSRLAMFFGGLSLSAGGHGLRLWENHRKERGDGGASFLATAVRLLLVLHAHFLDWLWHLRSWERRARLAPATASDVLTMNVVENKRAIIRMRLLPVDQLRSDFPPRVPLTLHLRNIVEPRLEIVGALAVVGYGLPEVDGVLQLHKVDGGVEAVHAHRIVAGAVRTGATVEKVVICYLQTLVVVVSLILLITVEVHVRHVVPALLALVRLAPAIFGLLLAWPGAFLRGLLTLRVVGTSPAAALVGAAADGLQFAVDAAHVRDVLLEGLLSSLVLLLEGRDVILVLFDVDLGLLSALVLPEELLHLFELLLDHE
jgi:hypothetical protein